MAGVDKIIDKKKRNMKIVAISAFSLLIFVVLVRAVSVKANGDVALDYRGPDYDSVVLPKTEGKIEQYKKEEQEKREQQFALKGNKEEPVNVNFEKLYVNKAENPEPTQNESKQPEAGQKTGPVENRQPKQKPKQSNDEGGYVEADNYEDYVKKKQARQNATKENAAQNVAQKEAAPVQQEKPSNPFGTQAVYKASAVTGVVKKDMYKCEVHSDQKVANGGALIMRCVEDMEIGGKKIPKNSLVYGMASYSNNRVKVIVTRIKSPSGDVVATCSVYDNDFIEGIFFKNSVDKAVDESADDVGEAIGDKAGGIVGAGVKVATEVGKNVKNAVKDRKLNVHEGYVVYIKEIKRQ